MATSRLIQLQIFAPAPPIQTKQLWTYVNQYAPICRQIDLFWMIKQVYKR